jgi:glyoxylase-like metal-dependent hydrolase (beta-lactamase superfamily II)
MVNIHQFIFNNFQENTYILWDETGECVIIDPGCYYPEEKEDLAKYIAAKELKPVLLLNTHCHLDHVFGNKWVKEKFGIPLLAHPGDEFFLKNMKETAAMYGFGIEESPMPDRHLEDGGEVTFGKSKLRVIHTPGHSPGGVCFVNDDAGFIIGGDVLFQGSIGRFDLPGGNYETLMESIFTRLLIFPDTMKVYNGHGPATTVGTERRTNPFLLEYELESKKS